MVKLHSFCLSNQIEYSIKYATDAVCWTQVPERLRDLFKQRRRWHLGLFQSMTKHTGLFANVKYGAVSLISYLYFLLYELLSLYIEIYAVITMILAFLINIIDLWFMVVFLLICTEHSILTLNRGSSPEFKPLI